MNSRQRRSERRRAPCPPLACLLLCLAAGAACGEGRTVAVSPRLSLEGEAALDFGEVPVLLTREARLTLVNVGRGPLSIFDLRVEPASAPVAITEAPATIVSGERAWITLTYAPKALGALDATLRFSTDDPDQGELSIALLGQSSTQGRLEFTAGLDFEGVCEGGARTGRVEVRSTGTADLELTGVELLQDEGGAFSIIGSTRTPLAIPSGESIVLTLRHAPPFGATGQETATLVLASSDPDRPRIEIPISAAINGAPVAHIAPFPGLAPGAVLTLDGSGSSDPEGEGELAHRWSIVSAPADSKAAIAQATEAVATLDIDVAGSYLVSLSVTDPDGCVSTPAEATAIAQTAEALRFELFWDNVESDLDLHLVPEGGDFFGTQDCHFAEGQLSPDWGVPGEPADDPTLTRDALTGYGPEIISFPAPAPGRYRALVHYFSAHHATASSTLATLRLYRFGVLLREVRRTLSSEGARWEVLAVTWPGGDFALIDDCEACE